MIELAGVAPKDVLVNYKSFKVMVRQGGKLCPGSSLLMLQPCTRNVGLAGFFNGTSEDHGNEEDLLTLGRQRCKDIPSGKAVAIGLWRLLRMIIGCGRYRIFVVFP